MTGPKNELIEFNSPRRILEGGKWFKKIDFFFFAFVKDL